MMRGKNSSFAFGWAIAMASGLLLASEARTVPLGAAESSAVEVAKSAGEAKPSKGDQAPAQEGRPSNRVPPERPAHSAAGAPAAKALETTLAPATLSKEQLQELLEWSAQDAWRGAVPTVIERLEPWMSSMKSDAPDAELARAYWQRLATAYVALEQLDSACEPLKEATRLGGGIHGPSGGWASPLMEQVEKQCDAARQTEVP